MCIFHNSNKNIYIYKYKKVILHHNITKTDVARHTIMGKKKLHAKPLQLFTFHFLTIWKEKLKKGKESYHRETNEQERGRQEGMKGNGEEGRRQVVDKKKVRQ